jgi:hypothetical protein
MRPKSALRESTPAGVATWRSRPARVAKTARLDVRFGAEADASLSAPRSRGFLKRFGVQEALGSPNQPLGPALRTRLEHTVGFDLGKVRIHTDKEAAVSARHLGAEAYTVGSHIVFGSSLFDPASSNGHSLLAHELTHVAQQGAPDTTPIGPIETAPNSSHEAEASRAASQPGFNQVAANVAPGTIQRKVAMRDVGKGEQSGFARVPALITRLNTVSTGLIFALTGPDLTYTVKPGGKLSNFDTQMQGFIDQAAVIPLRFTNRHGLLGDKVHGFTTSVTEDAWSSGYVDIDDLLASSDLGMQEVLVHFLRERTATKNYEKRIGSESLNTDPAVPGGAAHQAEFDRAHGHGIQAELAVLQDFFADPSIRLVDHDSGTNIFRVYRNGRKDTIRTRLRPGRGEETGVDAIIVEVVTRDGKVHTPEEYKAILAAASAASAPSGTTSLPSGPAAGRGATIPS